MTTRPVMPWHQISDVERVVIDGRKENGRWIWNVDVLTTLADGHATGSSFSDVCEAAVAQIAVIHQRGAT